MDHAALFIIDVQKGDLVPACAAMPGKIEKLQELYDHIAVFRFVNLPGSPHHKWLGMNYLMAGSPEAELAFAPVPHAQVFDKHIYSALSDEVRVWLDHTGVDEVHICGNRTENCVLKTAVDLFEDGRYRPVVLADYCYSKHADLHKAALSLLEKFIGKDQIVYE